MRSLNLDQLHSFETVIELASFTAAAKRLNLSQSTISVQIRELEKRFGIRLVERLGKRAAPTPAGRELIEHARRLAAEAEQAAAAMRRRREGSIGQVNIGATTTGLNYFLAPVLRELRLRHPNLDLTIVVGDTAGLADLVVRGAIDFGLVNLPIKEPSIHVLQLRNEPLVAVFPSDATDLPRYVTPEYLAQRRLLLEGPRALIRAMTLDWLSPTASQLRPAMQLDNFDTIIRLVGAGLGASIAPERAVKDHLRRGEVTMRPLRPPLERILGLITHKNKVLRHAMRIFYDAVVEATGRKRRGKPDPAFRDSM
jgi:DNA-binding transcriptional LysR family regulator